MDKRIRVVVTTTYEYVPQLDDHEYRENGIDTPEKALMFDQQEYADGEISLEELCADDYKPTSTSEWCIINE